MDAALRRPQSPIAVRTAARRPSAVAITPRDATHHWIAGLRAHIGRSLARVARRHIARIWELATS